MSVFLTSDWHFGHAAMPKTGRGWRPFETMQDHDETLIANHNYLVGPDDVVWVLGDVAMGKIADSLANCARMNGVKNLICGNHDRPAMTGDPVKRGMWSRRYMDEGGFAAVLLFGADQPAMTLSSVDPSRHLLACHYPYEGDHTSDERYADLRPQDTGEWLLHGHVHDAWKVRGRQINVGVDVWDFAPVAASRIIELIAESEDLPAP